jgi:hypothetical protein
MNAVANKAIEGCNTAMINILLCIFHTINVTDFNEVCILLCTRVLWNQIFCKKFDEV